MSLLGALSIGQSSLVAQQAALQVTGNNISNANTPGYSRQVANLQTNGSQKIGGNNYIGTGVNVATIERQVSDAVSASLRDSTTSQQQASTLQDYLNRLESTFGALNDGDLTSHMESFFNNISTLANNPQDSGQRAVVVQSGASLASYLQTLRSAVQSVRTDAEAQLNQLAGQANNLADKIATLNQKITVAETGGATANTLRDQRDTALSDLSKLINIKALDQGNGQITVLVGNATLVQGTASRGISTNLTTDPTGKLSQTNLVFADNGDPMNITGGSIGGLITARDDSIAQATNTLDSLASTLINTINTIHSQGQGTVGFSEVTGASIDKAPALALNTALKTTGLPSTPTNGSFNLNVKDLTTGLITTRQIQVDFNSASPTTLNSLAASLTSGSIVATVDVNGHLNIKSTDSNNTFTFSDDSSGTLAALGINTFFTGTDASNIAINQTITTSPSLLATGRDNLAGSNKNALALALGYTTSNSQLAGASISDFYSQYIGNLATQSAGAKDEYTAQTAVVNTLTSQQQAISGVNMDEEAINMIKFQRAFEGSAKYISVVNQMMQTVLGLIS